MNLELNPHPQIEVMYWDTSNVSVRCPYCGEVHRHSCQLPGRRQSHCFPGGCYQFSYPVDEDNGLVGYEIDKRRARFVNISCLDELNDLDRSSAENDKHELAVHMQLLGLNDTDTTGSSDWKLWSDSIETFTMPEGPGGTSMTMKWMPFVVSDCLFGDLAATRKYLETSEESKLFLHGRERNGDTILIMKARDPQPEMVSLLIKSGANVNAVNGQGRSALMEAALWGRLENVKILLKANANTHLKDNEGHSALYFVKLLELL